MFLILGSVSWSTQTWSVHSDDNEKEYGKPNYANIFQVPAYVMFANNPLPNNNPEITLTKENKTILGQKYPNTNAGSRKKEIDSVLVKESTKS